jgi:hypothetical protein
MRTDSELWAERVEAIAARHYPEGSTEFQAFCSGFSRGAYDILCRGPLTDEMIDTAKAIDAAIAGIEK